MEMADARLELTWLQTSYIVATVRNVNRGKGQRIITPQEVSPYRSRHHKALPKARMSDVRGMIEPAFKKIAEARNRRENPPHIARSSPDRLRRVRRPEGDTKGPTGGA